MNTPWQDMLKQYRVAKEKAGVDLSAVPQETLPAHKLRKGMAAELAAELEQRIGQQLVESTFAIFLPSSLPSNRVKRFAQLAPAVDGSIVVLDASQVYRELSTSCAGAVQTRTLTPQNVQDLSVVSAELAQRLNVQPFFFPGASKVHSAIDDQDALVAAVRTSIRETNRGNLNGAFLQRETVRLVLEDEERDDQPVVCLILNATKDEAAELKSFFGLGSFVVDELPGRDSISTSTVEKIFTKARESINLKK